MLIVTGQRDFKSPFGNKHPGDDSFHLLHYFDEEAVEEVTTANTIAVRISPNRTEVEVVDLIEGESKFVHDLKGRVLVTMRYHSNEQVVGKIQPYVYVTDEAGTRFKFQWVDSKSNDPMPKIE